jgi:hypothetical protein
VPTVRQLRWTEVSWLTDLRPTFIAIWPHRRLAEVRQFPDLFVLRPGTEVRRPLVRRSRKAWAPGEP